MGRLVSDAPKGKWYKAGDWVLHLGEVGWFLGMFGRELIWVERWVSGCLTVIPCV